MTSITGTRLRVGLFTDSYTPSRNGVAIAVDQLRAHLAAHGHEVVMVAPRGRSTGRFTQREFLMSSVRVRGIHPPLATGSGFRRCARELTRMELDLVHVHGFGPVSLLGIHVARRAGVPLVITWHTDLIGYVRHYRHLAPVLAFWAVVVRKVCGRVTPDVPTGTTWRESGATAVCAAILRSASLVIAPSRKTSTRMAPLAGGVPVVTLPTGVDPIPPTAPLRGFLWTRPVFLYVGRIAPEKGIEFLLDAFLRLRADLPDATLVLVGDYTCARGLRRRLRVMRGHGVDVVGEIARSAVGGYYAAADVFVFPSTTDTQGLVLHEAAHAGVPIVLVDDELAGDLPPGSPVLVTAPHVTALAGAMKTMAERRAEAGVVRRDGRRFAAPFSAERQHEALVARYLGCVDQRATRA
jgi:glycosyltransferase involved in cell wall biosynthesis